jgi:FkbM family methyltransferase
MSFVSKLKFTVRRKLGIYKGNQEYHAKGNHEYHVIYSLQERTIHVAMRHRNGPEREFRLRAGTSDLTVFRDVFHRLQYSTHNLMRQADLRARYNAILAAKRRPLIIDAGGNIGLTALYYRDAYPEAAIVSIEPERENFVELSRHIGNDPLMLLLRAALSGRDGESEIINPGAQAWEFRTRFLTNASGDTALKVPALSVDSVVALAAERWSIEPFIIKIDIEGGEADVFQGQSSWIDRFYVVIVELHDWMLPRSGSSKAFLSAIAGRDRDFLLKGENILSISNADPNVIVA